ncbi:hypothetical protein D3C84_1247170 [compost metagenome]
MENEVELQSFRLVQGHDLNSIATGAFKPTQLVGISANDPKLHRTFRRRLLPQQACGGIQHGRNEVAIQTRSAI